MGEFRMPSLGADMEAGTLVEWRVAPGQAVARGDVVAVVETDKGAIDVEIWQGGVVDELKVAPGTTVPVGTVLATVGEGAPSARAPSAEAPSAVRRPPSAAPSAAPIAAVGPGAVAEGGGRKAEGGLPHVRASPSARQLARERGVELAAIHGTGPSGAITRADVEHAVAPAPVAPAPVAAVPVAPVPAAPVPVAPAPVAPVAAAASRPARAASAEAMRRAIATAMERAKREIPHYYVQTDIDVAPLRAWLDAENRRRPVAERLLPAVPLVKAVARALARYPELNGLYTDGTFHPSPAVHLGFAVALRQGGLIAPALHDADRRPLDELRLALGDLIQRARAGQLRSSELADPTATVTSLGERGVQTVFGIIHPPQVAIVGLGRIVERPWAVGGLLGIRPVLSATLSADHRVSDGHRGALFLATLGQLLAEPEKL